jgi:hypothetical protein
MSKPRKLTLKDIQLVFDCFTFNILPKPELTFNIIVDKEVSKSNDSPPPPYEYEGLLRTYEFLIISRS